MVVAGFATLFFWRQGAPNTAIKTVAVLPFKPLVAEKRDEALELGMADALVAKLSSGEEIAVRPFSAVRRYSSLEQDSVLAGRELGVDAVLDGSIQISGDKIRVLAKLLNVRGMHSEAVAAAQKAGEISGNSQSIAYRAYALSKWGRPAEARAVLEGLLKLAATQYVPPYNIALVCNGLGEREMALDYLQKGFAEKDMRMVFLKVEPAWDSLRSAPRFNTLLKRMGIEE